MLLNRLILLIIVVISVGCADTVSQNKTVYRVDFKNKSGQKQISELEDIMLKNNINRIKSVTITYNKNYAYAREIKERLISEYGIKPTLKSVGNADVNVSVFVENVMRTPDSCYHYSVDDYNWYKSSYAEMQEYEQAKICPITIND